LDIDWRFEKVSGIQSQIAKLEIEERTNPPSRKTSDQNDLTDDRIRGGPDTAFASLKSFYSSHLSISNPTDPLLTPSGSYSYSSPSSLARIMSLYTSRGGYGKKNAGKASSMRESADVSEGLRTVDLDSDQHAVERLRSHGWTAANSIAQQVEQRSSPKFSEDLRPKPIYLRTKRSKRCRICRHILVKPEAKVTSTRFKIKLIAINYIPTISVKPLQPSLPTQLPLIDLEALPASKPVQFLLSLKNPLFETIKVILGTPAKTPGRFGHKVTVLCPEFDVGPNVDQWDEALGSSNDSRSSKLHSTSKVENSGGEGGKVAEAGKVWEKGRNWTTVVVEAVCAPLRIPDEDMAEDEDILEIPLYVRIEWETDTPAEVGGVAKLDERRERRELAYWTVLGVGRVARQRESCRTGFVADD